MHGLDCESLRPTARAAKHSGFMPFFEAFATRALQASRSTQTAGDLLGINWHPIQATMERAVERGLACREHLLHADIIHHKLHISQHLANAVDKTRRIEHAKLQKQGDESLTKTKYLWLRGMESLGDEALARLRMLGRCELGVLKAWGFESLGF